jgi:hypothetical protein
MKRFILGICLIAATTMAIRTPARAATATPTVVLPSELIYIDRFGVNPASITRPQGQFVLIFHNRLPGWNETAQVLLSGSTPNANTPTLTTSPGLTLTGQVLNLAPGSYVVSFQNNPGLSVTLTITGQ